MSESVSGNLTSRANRLYWETTRSATDVADELGVSRSKLYALVEPLSTGRSCPQCGAGLVFSNRTEREARRGRCLECGTTADLPEEELSSASPEAGVIVEEERVAAAASQMRPLWIGAACGVAAGFMAGAWFRRH